MNLKTKIDFEKQDKKVDIRLRKKKRNPEAIDIRISENHLSNFK